MSCKLQTTNLLIGFVDSLVVDDAPEDAQNLVTDFSTVFNGVSISGFVLNLVTDFSIVVNGISISGFVQNFVNDFSTAFKGISISGFSSLGEGGGDGCWGSSFVLLMGVGDAFLSIRKKKNSTINHF